MTHQGANEPKQSEMQPVDELKALLESQPGDDDVKEDLVWALVERYIGGDKTHEQGDEGDISLAKATLKRLPQDMALWPRAYLSYLDSDEQQCIAWLVKYVRSQDDQTPFDSSGLLAFFLGMFNLSPESWNTVAAAVGRAWPESAAAFTMQGVAKEVSGDFEGATLDFARALEIDASYWSAAWECADVYYGEKNWRAAVKYYDRALESPDAQQHPDIHFYLAWCLGKTKDYSREEEHYRACLELDPDYPSARNNLGWSLCKQGRHKDALPVFEEAIKRGNDGKTPLWNKAAALKKLGCLQEAIEVLRQDVDKKGNLTRYAQQEITRLQARTTLRSDPEVEDRSLEPAGPKRRKAMPPSEVSKEQWLEMHIVESIVRGDRVFGRSLRMYDEGPYYGRQLPIPECNRRLDLLVEDLDTQDLIVVELKRGRADDAVVGQIASYMAWVRDHLAKPGQKVRGIICVHEASRSLHLSVSSVPELEIRGYRLEL
jgi:tetratricopeptide (TPR) repeat protein